MNIATWLQNKDIENFPLLGFESFASFIKLCESTTKWALDDVGLANRSNTYKIWVSWTKDAQKLRNDASKYKSMNLLSHYLNVEIVENAQIGLYIALDWIQNKWQMSYGITNNKKLYKIGQFAYSVNVNLPVSPILKYVKDEILDFNPRTHYLLRLIKASLHLFDPGYCQRQDPYIINEQCVLTCHGLGEWTESGTMNEDQANEWLQKFKEWVSTMEWWNSVKILTKIRKGNYIDFIIEIK